jgi:hypothetical protein
MNIFTPQQGTPKADLYRLVFNTRYVKYMVTAMMLFFLLHPVMPAFASELEAGNEASEISESAVAHEPEAVPEPEPETEPESVSEPVTVIDELEVAVAEDVPLVVPSEETTVGVDTVLEEETSVLLPDSPVDVSPIDAAPDSSIDVPVDDVSESQPADAATDSVDEEEILPDTAEEADATGTTTVPEPEYIEVTNEVTHSDTHYQFEKASCVSMGSGAFHCFDTTTEAIEVTEDALYVDRDSDGDKEIYLRTNGDVVQITDNTLDDDAPYFDPVSNTIVWHRLEGGQYQVYSYQDKRETLVSNGFGSSMEPHRSGQYTVWQSWINDQWQVVLHDGEGARVISTGGAQSIAPQVEGAYVIWNVTTGDTHTVAVYEIATGLTSMIDDGEGARVMNPRFVLVYDTKFENGDVITKGYDAETGDVIPLAAAPASVPAELPSSDQTGETRALLQNKSSSRDEFSEELEPTGTGTSTPNGQGTDATGDALIVVSTTTEAAVLPLTDFDLIVEPFSAAPQATTSSQ